MRPMHTYFQGDWSLHEKKGHTGADVADIYFFGGDKIT